MEKKAQSKLPDFIGREAELGTLNHALSQMVKEKQPRFVFIEGEGGIGKSALVERFLGNVADQHTDWMIGQGDCSVALQEVSLMPFCQIVQQLTSQGVRLKIIRGNLANFAKNVAAAWLDVIVSGAGTAAKATIEEVGRAGRLPEQFSSENVYLQFHSLLKQLTKNHPAILYIDALEFADESTLRLMFYLISRLSDRAILVLTTYRPYEMQTTGKYHKVFKALEADIPTAREHCVIRIPLDTGLDVSEYLNERYPKNTFPPQLAKVVQVHTDGLPLFVSQLFSFWEEKGVVLFTAGDTDRSASISSSMEQIQLSMPRKLGDLLDQRFRALDKHLQEIIQNASVEGEQFTAEVIAGLGKLEDEAQALRGMFELDTSYKLVQQQHENVTDSRNLSFYRFVHLFIREYVYKETLSNAQHHFLHREVGRRIEKLYADDLSPVAEQLSSHFKIAGELSKAAYYALMAANKRRSPPAWIEASHWCEEGLDLVAKLPSTDENKLLKFKLLEQAAYCYNAGGGGGQVGKAIEKFKAALALAQELNIDYERAGAIYARLADIFELTEDYDASEQVIRDGLDLLFRNGMPLCSARLELEALQAFNQMRRAGDSTAIAKWQQILDEGRKLPVGTPFERFAPRIVYWGAIALANQGRYREAISAYQDSIKRAEAVGGTELTLTPMLNLADEYLKLSEVNESEENAEKALDLARQMGDQDNEAYALAVLGGCHLERGETSLAIEKFKQAIALFEKIDSRWNLSYTYAELAFAYSLESKFEAADTAGQRAFHHAFDGDDKYAQGYVLDRLAQIEFARGNNELSEQHFKNAKALFEEGQYKHFTAKTELHYAKLLMQQGKREQAARLLLKVLEIFEELGIAADIDEARKLLEET